MTLEFLIIIILLLINALLAMAEFAITNSRRNKIQQLIDEGNKKAATILEYKNSPNQYLSIIQIGITFIGLLAGAFSGTTIAQSLAVLLKDIPYISRFSEQIAVIIVVGVLSYLALLSELIPKRLALQNPEKLALFSVGITKLLSKIAKPLVDFSSKSTDFILKIFGFNPKFEPSATEEEIVSMIDQGKKEGIFETEETNIFKRVFNLDDQSVSAIMTPIGDIEYIDLQNSHEENQNILINTHHSYLPICDGDINKIVGVVHVKDILSNRLENKEINFIELKNEPHYISENTTVLSLIQKFKKSSVHIAFVLDEYGFVQGLVTLNDILSSIVGTLPDEDDYEVSPPIKRDDNSWLLDGKLSLLALKEILQIEELPEEERGDYQTLAGFILYQIKQIPNEGEYFIWNNFKFEIVDMDLKRIDKVLVKKIVNEKPIE